MSSSEKVWASHILIKHEGSRRKSSWKDPEGTLISATTRDDAVSQLLALRRDILSGDASFKELATQHSHCSSAKRGGDLGPFGILVTELPSSLSLRRSPFIAPRRKLFHDRDDDEAHDLQGRLGMMVDGGNQRGRR